MIVTIVRSIFIFLFSRRLMTRDRLMLVTLCSAHFLLSVGSILSAASCKAALGCNRSLELKALDIAASMPVFFVVTWFPSSGPAYVDNGAMAFWSIFVNSLAAGGLIYLVGKSLAGSVLCGRGKGFGNFSRAATICCIWIFAVAWLDRQFQNLIGSITFAVMTAGLSHVFFRVFEGIFEAAHQGFRRRR